MSDYPLTDEQIAFYRENGFVKLPNVLSPAEVETARAALAEALEVPLSEEMDRSDRGEYSRIFVQKVNLWRAHAGIRELVCHPRIAEIARRLAGAAGIRLWHDHALIKMPGDSKETPWHQDLPYWPMHEAGPLSCWLALDDVDERNGCMRFVAGSQKYGQLEPIRLANPQSIFDQTPDLSEATAPIVSVPLQAGSCTFHNGNTFHYAPANRSDRPRRAMVTIYMPDGETYRDKPHPVTNGLNLQEGEPLAGELFPLLATGPAA